MDNLQDGIIVMGCLVGNVEGDIEAHEQMFVNQAGNINQLNTDGRHRSC